MIKVTCGPAKNKKSYTVNFRHPVVKDKSGKYGLKIHRGLGTDDEVEAERLANKLSELANNEYWWDRSKRKEAYNQYPDVIVDAFYDCMEEVVENAENYLNRIHLPGRDEGYIRSLIFGPSGVGKTSFLRNMMGTTKEKFPTTSTGRTTTCNMEIIFSEDAAYEVVVTFMPRVLVEMYTQECIEAAVEYCLEQKCQGIDLKILAEKLLIHRDLIVRLSYILGDLTLKADEDYGFDEELEFDVNESEEDEADEYKYKQDTESLVRIIIDFLDRVRKIATVLLEDRSDLEDAEFDLEETDDVLQLRDDIINEIIKRFGLIDKGEKLNVRGKWVNAWYFKTTDRSEFIKTVKMFTSNSKRAWGGLLTPIVQTIRVKGNFKSEDIKGSCKMVLFDGQGLGHKTTATSIPNELIKYFELSDSIILVDNAQAPMLENIKMALKAVIEYGFAKKLAMLYTHVDMMEGNNFSSFADRKRHVLAALESYLFEMKKNNAYIFSEVEASAIRNATFFFSDLDKVKTSKMTQHYTVKLYEYLRDLLQESITIGDVRLKYDAMTLVERLKIALASYRQEWGGRIGYPHKTSDTEHWSKIKALTRRLAYFNQDHYNYELMPLADFRQEVAEQLNVFLNKPLLITPEEASEEVKVALISEVKSQINNKIAKFVAESMWRDQEQLERWIEAYSFTKQNSTYYRAAKINEIFELAAPQIGQFSYNMTDIQKQYVMKVIEIVESTLNEYDSELSRFDY